jgi:hypothetical protein
MTQIYDDMRDGMGYKPRGKMSRQTVKARDDRRKSAEPVRQ